jgi:hypothetical protein
MKNLIIAAFTVSTFILGCAPKMIPKSNSSSFEFSLVDTIQGTKNELYVKSYEWIAKTFTSAKDVIQMNDKEAGKIIAKAVIAVPGTKNGYGMTMGDDYVHYTISIDVKDNRYRCIISDFYHEGGNYSNSHPCSGGSLDNNNSACSTMYMSVNRWNNIKTIVQKDAESNLSALKKYVRTKSNDF